MALCPIHQTELLDGICVLCDIAECRAREPRGADAATAYDTVEVSIDVLRQVLTALELEPNYPRLPWNGIEVKARTVAKLALRKLIADAGHVALSLESIPSNAVARG